MPTHRCVSDSDDIWVGVRPEKIQVDSTTHARDRNSVRGTVTDTSYIGVSTQYLVRLPWGQDLTVIRQNDGAPIPARATRSSEWDLRTRSVWTRARTPTRVWNGRRLSRSAAGTAS